MSSHESTDQLTALVPERYESELLDRSRAAEVYAHGFTTDDDRVVVMSDVPVTVVGRKRVGK
jgi:hypothetical protein